jgi:hypothetical protein
VRWLLVLIAIATLPAKADEALWQALTGEHPAMGEVPVLKPDSSGLRVAGRLSMP